MVSWYKALVIVEIAVILSFLFHFYLKQNIGFLHQKEKSSNGLTIYFSKNPICKNCNVVLISIDTLRADHMSLYEYSRNTTPYIDRFAKKSIVFTNTFSNTFWTLPSHMTIFTGMYPSIIISHIKNNQAKIPKDIHTLPEVLAFAGYKCAGFTGGGYVSSIYGFNRGFSIYTEEHSFSQTVPEAIQWLNDTHPKKFFIFLHGYDVHKPYDNKPEPFNSMFVNKTYNGILKGIPLNHYYLNRIKNNKFYLRNGTVIELDKSDVDYIISHYDGGVRYADYWIGRFLDFLKSKGLLNNTIIIITSDHGEDLGEHGDIGHWMVYDNMIHVPLIVYIPNVPHKVINSLVESIDITPTIMDLIGIKTDQKFSGKSLLPSIEDGVLVHKYIISEYIPQRPNGIYWFPQLERVAVRNDKWKYIFNLYGSDEAYEIEKDPYESQDTIFSMPSKTKKYLKSIVLSHMKNVTKIDVEKYKKIENQLRNLGYLK